MNLFHFYSIPKPYFPIPYTFPFLATGLCIPKHICTQTWSDSSSLAHISFKIWKWKWISLYLSIDYSLINYLHISVYKLTVSSIHTNHCKVDTSDGLSIYNSLMKSHSRPMFFKFDTHNWNVMKSQSPINIYNYFCTHLLVIQYRHHSIFEAR